MCHAVGLLAGCMCIKTHSQWSHKVLASSWAAWLRCMGAAALAQREDSARARGGCCGCSGGVVVVVVAAAAGSAFVASRDEKRSAGPMF
eukprot:COSAG02_NODE_4082_length_5808_cov_3.266071_2_plen_89_part_00